MREGILKVTISSPTLAQGLNLSATAVIIHSLFRNRERIETSEFKNVVGRAGRAYVDVEGLVLYPIFDDMHTVHDGRTNRLWITGNGKWPGAPGAEAAGPHGQDGTAAGLSNSLTMS